MLMNPFGRHHPSALGIGLYYGSSAPAVEVDEGIRALLRRLVDLCSRCGR